MLLLKLSEGTAARRRIPIRLVDDTDGKTEETGLTFSGSEIRISKNGAAAANGSGAVTEIAEGDYYYEATSGELDTIGFFRVRISKTGVRTFVGIAQVVSFDPYDATALGLSRIDAAITSRSSHSAADVWTSGTRTLTSFGTLVADIWSYATRELTGFSTSLALSVWNVLESAIVTGSSIGLKVKTNLDAAITSRSSHTAADVWAVGTRTLTSFGTLVSDIWSAGTRELTGFSTALAVSVWDVLEAAIATASSIGLKVKTNLNATISSRAVPGDAMDLVTDAVDATALADNAAAEIADKLLGRSIGGGADGGRTVTSALRRIRNRVAIAAGTMTVYQENDSTSDHTAAVTTTAGNPISEVDPT